jgi:hypothetical protein
LAGVALNALFARWRTSAANRQSVSVTEREPGFELGGPKKG